MPIRAMLIVRVPSWVNDRNNGVFYLGTVHIKLARWAWLYYMIILVGVVLFGVMWLVSLVLPLSEFIKRVRTYRLHISSS
jgi:hypothetical protein